MDPACTQLRKSDIGKTFTDIVSFRVYHTHTLEFPCSQSLSGDLNFNSLLNSREHTSGKDKDRTLWKYAILYLFHVSYSQYFLVVGNLPGSEHHLGVNCSFMLSFDVDRNILCLHLKSHKSIQPSMHLTIQPTCLNACVFWTYKKQFAFCRLFFSIVPGYPSTLCKTSWPLITTYHLVWRNAIQYLQHRQQYIGTVTSVALWWSAHMLKIYYLTLSK